MYSRMAKDFLRAHHIPFVERDVTEHREYIQTLAKKTGQMGVPVVEAKGQVLIGFQELTLRDMFHIPA